VSTTVHLMYQLRIQSYNLLLLTPIHYWCYLEMGYIAANYNVIEYVHGCLHNIHDNVVYVIHWYLFTKFRTLSNGLGNR